MIKFNSIDKAQVKFLISICNIEIIYICDFLRHLKNANNIGEKCLMLANDNNAEAQYILSNIFKWGILCKPNEHYSLKWCEKAVENNYIPSYFSLAGFYGSGTASLKVDYNKAMDLYHKAASSNYIPALTTLGFLYCDGYLTTKNIEAGICFYEKAVKLDSSHAMYCLSQILLDNSEGFRNEKKGLKLLIDAANNGYPDAHYRLKYIYKNGEYSIKKSKVLFEKHSKMENRAKDNMIKSCLDGL